VIRHSLRLRMLLVSTVSITAALFLAGLVLVELFERHVERRVNAELAGNIRQLAGHVGFANANKITLSINLADPRFAEPLSGLYWQVQEGSSDNRLRSRSLWDYVLPLPADVLQPGVSHQHRLVGPGGSSLIARERLIVYDTPDGARTIRIAVAIDTRTIEQAAAEFAADVRFPLLALALFLFAVAAFQIWFGLRPLEAVRRGVRQIRSRDGGRLNGQFPDEVMPLVSEVNELLDAQDRTIEQARHQAANLAHALKTPLTVMMGDAEKLKHAGQTEIADELADLARQMHRHLDRELARTRVANQAVRRGSGKADIVETTRAVVRTLQRTPRGGFLSWEIEGPSMCMVAVDLDDLSDLIGNVLDNASKWARTRITVSITEDKNEAIFAVTDDGPGAPADQLDGLRQRGIRLDEKKPGSGIGLAIVDDIASAYGGKVVLKSLDKGGFSASVSLPAVAGTDHQ
jgi:signal transduction histidine kinase